MDSRPKHPRNSTFPAESSERDVTSAVPLGHGQHLPLAWRALAPVHVQVGIPPPVRWASMITGHHKALMMKLVSWGASKHGHSIPKPEVAAAPGIVLF